MGSKVIWSAKAEKDLAKLLEYLAEHFGKAYASKYLSKLLVRTENLLLQPTRGIPTGKRKNLRRLVLDKHNFLIYSISDQGIIIKNIMPYKQNRSGF